jgi:hypothetical protein
MGPRTYLDAVAAIKFPDVSSVDISVSTGSPEALLPSMQIILEHSVYVIIFFAFAYLQFCPHVNLCLLDLLTQPHAL